MLTIPYIVAIFIAMIFINLNKQADPAEMADSRAFRVLKFLEEKPSSSFTIGDLQLGLRLITDSGMVDEDFERYVPKNGKCVEVSGNWTGDATITLNNLPPCFTAFFDEKFQMLAFCEMEKGRVGATHFRHELYSAIVREIVENAVPVEAPEPTDTELDMLEPGGSQPGIVGVQTGVRAVPGLKRFVDVPPGIVGVREEVTDDDA